MTGSSGQRPARRAFTLIELLVVIAIIGVLVALIMPAVQQARETARRAQCQNNLKQLGLAATQYHDSFNSFPSGWYCLEDDANCIDQGASPYMWSGMSGLFLKLEQGNLFNEINFDLSPYAPDNVSVIKNSLGTFVCPSNRPTTPVQIKTGGPTGTASTLRIGPADYRGNMAAGMIEGCTDPNDPNCYNYINGITFRNSDVNIADVSDGASNTLLIGETLTGTWPDATNCCVRTTQNRVVNKPIIIAGRKYNTYWMSKHPGQVNFVKVDGSILTVKDGINRFVLIKLASRNGGESISAEDIK